MTTKLHVGNLAPDTTDKDLRFAFGQYGQVVSATIERDAETGNSRGFGFVEMATQNEAAAAISELHAHELGGRMITVHEARTPAGR